MIDKDVYYNSMISRFTDEAALSNFLNESDIKRKFDDTTREYFAERWLKENGYVEVEEGMSIPNAPTMVELITEDIDPLTESPYIKSMSAESWVGTLENTTKA